MNPRSQIIQYYNRFTRTNIGHADKKYFGLVLHSLRTLWFKWFQVEGEWCWLVNSDHHSPPFSWMQTRFKISITSVNGAKKTVRFPQISFLLVLFSVTYKYWYSAKNPKDQTRTIQILPRWWQILPISSRSFLRRPIRALPTVSHPIISSGSSSTSTLWVLGASSSFFTSSDGLLFPSTSSPHKSGRFLIIFFPLTAKFFAKITAETVSQTISEWTALSAEI